ncbi:nitrate reductase [Desertibaculum subflavum]|uniref:nitrate reductase n=1 Tax=Desertibaculum subflavum TaxID=2268458 RepID=UPI000E665A87
MHGTPPATRTTCPYCGVGCGVLAVPDGRGGAAIAGDPDHPANFGRLCSKGAALGETLGLATRLLHPEIGDARVSWDAALDRVAEGFRDTVAKHGPDSVAFYVSGQLLTEDYYVANKLIKGFIGTANIDSNSRLCMASSVAGHKRAFGADLVPVQYSDLEAADLVVLVGSNLAWCHPVLFQRLAAAKAKRPALKVVNIDPRATATNDIADLHLALKPGSDVALFNGLLAAIVEAGAVDECFVRRHTVNFEQALATARRDAPDLAAVARTCDLPVADLQRFYAGFLATERVVTLWSQGVNQSSSGVDKVDAIINCHLATGRIGKAGMGPFSITGQPNAMGGREVGALANMLAAHLDFERPGDHDKLRRFWQAPNLAARPGLKAVDMFRAVGAGKIKAIWIMATNPAVSLPEADAVRRALGTCEFVVVSDCERDTDTARLAHVRLPALAWGEKEGTVTNSERRISRQAPFLLPPGEARADWWIVAQVAQRLGHGKAFAFDGPASIFREHAALTAFENGGTRDLDLGGLAGLSDTDYARFAPVQWPAPAARKMARPFADGRFYTADGRARFIAAGARPPMQATSGEHPLVLNTGRLRDQWHTMTRTAKSPRLSRHRPEPLLEMHPDDITARGLVPGSLARLTSRWGSSVHRVLAEPGMRRGEVFAPMHWTDALAGGVRVNAVSNPAVDPISGQPELKHTPVQVAPLPTAWSGLILTRRRLGLDLPYWVDAVGSSCRRYEVAGDTPIDAAFAILADQIAAMRPNLEVHDRTGRRLRAAWFDGDRLEACLFLAREPEPHDRDWLMQQFEAEALTGPDRLRLLAGRAGAEAASAGRSICVCFGIGENRIREAVGAGAMTVEALGERLGCGTNCGSCLPELRGLIAESKQKAVA